ncbi:tyrosine-type recombinase/integrase [Bradyrhizobium sp. KB893862 SZCCT0404]|uniref:tyrosine-type recombinase/integrase n=1 Tax=Bradyrhizobium sp. KB893862 SZCCT0404 TaxID=2807672 RepID=UPI001BA6AB49|nr:tyrosine-type recombinase/integrase [Bradyrhizobium sp. KB893862 SZCCT0404]MBR1174886.1 tyrosine-type recombinase/integrase [Bradyrhizobium sp. KB893862 SZCCT0404]
MSKRAKQNITNRHCTARVTQRQKIYDAECSGLYVSLSPTAPPTFSLKYTCPITKQRGTHRLGIYRKAEDGQPAHDVAYWRVEANSVKRQLARGEDISVKTRRAQDQQAKQMTTVSQLIDLRIAWCAEEITVRRHTEAGVILKTKPRFRAHAEMARHLERFVRPRLGPMIAKEVSNDDIAQLQADILAGTLIIKKGKTSKKDSVSSARHMRKAVSGLFNWAAEAGRKYVSASPCINLPPLPREEPRKRKLTTDEIRTLWHGLDRPDITVDRRICLAIKFALVSMLRSVELLHIHRDELVHDLNSAKPLVMIPEERVKAGREIHQPLSDLAVEIAKEAMGNHQWMFTGRWEGEPLNRKAMACALRGNRTKRNGKVLVRSVGLCEQLGIAPFTPHDLRRTAASLLGSLKVPRSIISMCLDHTVQKDEHGDVSPVTGKHYDQDPRVKEKREALQKLADEIRRIISEPANMNKTEAAVRRAA